MKPIEKKSTEEIIAELESLDVKSTTVDDIKKLISLLLDRFQIHAPVLEPVAHLFRGRICKKPTNIKEVLYPPVNTVEKYGRANDIGESMFYASIGKSFPFYELDPKVGDTLIISLWKSKSNLILNHIGFTDGAFKMLNSLRSMRPGNETFEFAHTTIGVSDLNSKIYHYLTKVFTKKVTKDEADYYKLSVAVAKIFLNGDMFDGLLYPTIAGDANSDNLVLKPNSVDKKLDFVYAQFLEVTNTDDLKFSFETLDTCTQLDSSKDFIWSGRTLSYPNEPNKTVTYTFSESDWWKRDENNNIIYPESKGDMIVPLTVLGKRFINEFPQCYRLGGILPFPVNNDTVNVKFDLCLDFDKKHKFIRVYIPKNLNPVGIANHFIVNINSYTNIDEDIMDAHFLKQGIGPKISIRELQFINKLIIYTETFINEALLLKNTNLIVIIANHNNVY